MHFGAIWASKEWLKVHLGLGLGRGRRTLTNKRCRIAVPRRETLESEIITGGRRIFPSSVLLLSLTSD